MSKSSPPQGCPARRHIQSLRVGIVPPTGGAAEEAMTLPEQLDGARMVRYDELSELTLCWFGGTFVHAYRADGTEAAYWGVDSHERNASEEEIRASMEARIIAQDYHA